MLRSIQTARAIAVSAVLLWHLEWVYNDLGVDDLHVRSIFYFGGNGVDLFFCISGFTIAHIIATRKIASAGAFFLRRIVRIYPFYWFFSVVYICVSAAGCLLGRRRVCGGGFELPKLAQSALLLPQHSAPPLVVAWSLEHEILFYFIAGAVCIVAGFGLRVLLAVLLTLWGIAVYWRVYLATGSAETGAWSSHLFSLFQIQFAVGVAIYLAKDRLTFLGVFPPLALGVAGFIATKALTPAVAMPFDELGMTRSGMGGLVTVVGFAVSSAAILLALINAEAAGWFDRGRFIATGVVVATLIGDASYAIYLAHPTIYGVLGRLFAVAGIHGASVWALALAVGLTVGLSILWFLTIERPFLKYANDRLPDFGGREERRLARSG